MRRKTIAFFTTVVAVVVLIPLAAVAMSGHHTQAPELYINTTSVVSTTHQPFNIGNLMEHPYLSVIANLAPEGFSIYRANGTDYTLILRGGAAGTLTSDGTLFDIGPNECAHFTLTLDSAANNLNISEDLRPSQSLQECISRH